MITSSTDPKRLARALNHLTRWKMLRELSLGEPREVSELAAIAGCPYDSATKHLRVLRKCGLIIRGRGRLFQIPKHFLTTPGQRIIDYGHCLLRLEAKI